MTAAERAAGPSIGLRIIALVGGLALVGGAIVLSSQPAAAAGLQRFSSCGDLRAHLASADVGRMETTFMATGDAIGGDDAAAAEQAAPMASGGERAMAALDADGGGTNTQVEGVDELDLVEVLRDGRMLIARVDRVLLVSADGRRVLDTLPTAPEPQLTFDDERGILWAVSTDWQSTALVRVALDGDRFGEPATWQVAGGLVDLRRRGDRAHLVVLDADLSDPVPLPEPEPLPEPSTTTTTTTEPPETTTSTEPPESTTTTTPPDATSTTVTDDDDRSASTADGAGLPFAGTSPVPCDEVLHSPLPGGVASTLVATFAADGALEPVAATEVVGAGDNVLVTDTALYVSTPSYDGRQDVTGLHRFDLDGLRHTGSGTISGRLLNQFSLDEHGGHLRAAVTVGMGGIGAVPVEGPAVDVTSPMPPGAGDVLNEIVVLDLDGALDVVGRTARFGKPGETLHGIRFAGDVAYAVTFLETDPFYVVDLSAPSAPAVRGELEIPGFSAYLHPVGPDRVVGFGPDGEGRVAARLFDVSDPATPRVVDTAPFASESPVVQDHHALRVDGDRLVVAALEYVARPLARCATVTPDDAARAAAEERLNDLYLQMDERYSRLGPDGDQAELDAEIRRLQREADDLAVCLYPDSHPQARIVTLVPTAERLGVTTIDTEVGDTLRVVPLSDGYLVVGSAVTRVGPTGATQTTVA